MLANTALGGGGCCDITKGLLLALCVLIYAPDQIQEQIEFKDTAASTEGSKSSFQMQKKKKWEQEGKKC